MSDELVDAVADEIYRLRFANKNVTSRALARAALAIIEPAVREECAKVAAGETGDPEWPAEAWISGRIAAAIRAGAKP